MLQLLDVLWNFNANNEVIRYTLYVCTLCALSKFDESLTCSTARNLMRHSEVKHFFPKKKSIALKSWFIFLSLHSYIFLYIYVFFYINYLKYNRFYNDYDINYV